MCCSVHSHRLHVRLRDGVLPAVQQPGHRLGVQLRARNAVRLDGVDRADLPSGGTGVQCHSSKFDQHA